jgi:hypothetical protein
VRFFGDLFLSLASLACSEDRQDVIREPFEVSILPVAAEAQTFNGVERDQRQLRLERP